MENDSQLTVESFSKKQKAVRNAAARAYAKSGIDVLFKDAPHFLSEIDNFRESLIAGGVKNVYIPDDATPRALQLMLGTCALLRYPSCVEMAGLGVSLAIPQHLRGVLRGAGDVRPRGVAASMRG